MGVASGAEWCRELAGDTLGDTDSEGEIAKQSDNEYVSK